MSSAEPILSQYFHAKACRMGIPLAGTFELTPRCNFNCKMCYVHLDKDEADRRGKELTADEWLDIAREGVKKGMLFLLLTGGEPLLRDDFPYLYTELQKMGLMVSINSNGALVDRHIELFKKYPPTRFNISLYGDSDETYEKLCSNRQFSKVVENIKLLQENGIAVKINVSFGPYNVEAMEGINRIAKELEIPIKPTTYLYPPIRVDKEETGDNKARFSAEDAARYEFICDKQRFEHGMFVKRTAAICQGVRAECDEDCDGIASEGISCRAGKSSFWVTWDGRMLPCGMMLEPVVFPREIGFEAAWEKIRKETEKIRMPAECKSCSVKHACHVCAAASYAETGRFDGKPEYICKMVRELLRLYGEEYEKMKIDGEITNSGETAEKE